MIYPTLAAAVAELKPDDKRRVYEHRSRPDKAPEYVIAVSPASAALQLIGEEKLSLVSQRDRYNAALESLMQKGAAK